MLRRRLSGRGKKSTQTGREESNKQKANKDIIMSPRSPKSSYINIISSME